MVYFSFPFWIIQVRLGYQAVDFEVFGSFYRLVPNGYYTISAFGYLLGSRSLGLTVTDKPISGNLILGTTGAFAKLLNWFLTHFYILYM